MFHCQLCCIHERELWSWCSGIRYQVLFSCWSGCGCWDCWVNWFIRLEIICMDSSFIILGVSACCLCHASSSPLSIAIVILVPEVMAPLHYSPIIFDKSLESLSAASTMRSAQVTALTADLLSDDDWTFVWPGVDIVSIVYWFKHRSFWKLQLSDS